MGNIGTALREKCPKNEVFSGPYFSVFSPNTGKYVPKKIRIWTFFTQCSSYVSPGFSPCFLFQILSVSWVHHTSHKPAFCSCRLPSLSIFNALHFSSTVLIFRCLFDAFMEKNLCSNFNNSVFGYTMLLRNILFVHAIFQTSNTLHFFVTVLIFRCLFNAVIETF